MAIVRYRLRCSTAVFGPGGKFWVQFWLHECGQVASQDKQVGTRQSVFPRDACNACRNMTQVLAKLVARSWLSPLWLVLTRFRRYLQTCVMYIKLYLHKTSCILQCLQRALRKLFCTGTLYDPNVWCSSAGSSASSYRTPTGTNITGYAHQHCNTNTTWLHLLSEMISVEPC